MRIFGIVNVTPDSFSDGGQLASTEAAIDQALRLEDEGADVLDIGGESTRPGAALVPVDEERARVLPVIEGLAGRTSAHLSIDTRKPEVADDALAAGATIWNDVNALQAPGALTLAARKSCSVVLMHMRGEPGTMQTSPAYDDVVEEVFSFLAGRVNACLEAGCTRDKLIIDPGIGFGKTLEHNLSLFASLERFLDVNVEMMLGASRKSFIAALDREGAAADRLGGSVAAALRGLEAGASWVRVHDVAATRQALAVAKAVRRSTPI